MDGAQLDVNHMNDISGCSPYLFLSLVLLTWNLCFTQIGILRHEDAATKTYVYVVSLALFPVLSAATTPIKCCFSRVYRKRKCYTLFEVFLYDAIFMIMGTLYLAGDNLPVFICISKSNTTEMELCRKQSSIIEGVSLLLHAILYLVGQLQLRSTATLTLPVTGRIRKAYQNILQLVALTLFADQTFSTVVRYLTSTDIKIDKTPNCGCGNGTTAAECLANLNMEVGLFIASLSAIVLIIAISLIVKNLKDYCSCCCFNKLKPERGQCCWHLAENILIIMFYILAIAFMVFYTLGDHTWLWKCVLMSNGTQWREVIFSVTLVASVFWIGMYIFVICLPGVGKVWGNKKFLSRYRYAVLEYDLEDSRWKRKRVLAQPSEGQYAEDLTQCSGEFKIDNDCEDSFEVEEDTKCLNGLKNICCFCSSAALSTEEKNSAERKMPTEKKTSTEGKMLIILGQMEDFQLNATSNNGTLELNGEIWDQTGTQFWVIRKLIVTDAARVATRGLVLSVTPEKSTSADAPLEADGKDDTPLLLTPEPNISTKPPKLSIQVKLDTAQHKLADLNQHSSDSV